MGPLGPGFMQTIKVGYVQGCMESWTLFTHFWLTNVNPRGEQTPVVD
jgi:hypothetical protein